MPKGNPTKKTANRGGTSTKAKRTDRSPEEVAPRRQLDVPSLNECYGDTQYLAEQIIDKCRTDHFDGKSDTFDRITANLAGSGMCDGVTAYTWGMAKAVARRTLGVPLGK